MKNLVRFAVAAAGATWLVSCAQDVGDIDRTQPDRIDVSILNDGKPWWFLQTVIDVPPQSGLTFIGDASNGVSGTGLGINRIVWDIQENWLIAYTNYEFIANTQVPYSAIENDTVLGNGTPSSRTPYFGTPVAAYAITSHFDIERDYNAQTGEQENVIEENTTDRPWYERQYIRVDWGNNAFGGFNFMYETTDGESQGSILTSPLSYYVDQSDPTNPDAMEITPGYIGIVNKVSYTALVDTQLTHEYGETIYDCANQNFTLGAGDCAPGEVKIRLSFEKIPDTHDFVPRNYREQPDELMFGVWESTRQIYDTSRGVLEPLVQDNEYATMHHIWQADHYPTDPTTGLACDVNDTTNQNCIRPLNQRTPKPIVFYVSPGWPDISDATHYMMWVHEGLISDDYNSDMRSVTAGALRGWDSTNNDYLKTSVEYWMEHNTPAAIPFANNDAAIDYTVPDTSYSRYSQATGLDYLTYPPQLNPSTTGPDGGEDLSNTAADGTRPAGTYISNVDNDTLCSSGQIAVTKQDIAAGTPSAAPCHICDPTQGYCMGIEHVPYAVVPRMVVFCHNPVEVRQWGKANGPWTNPETGVTYASIDKSDSTNPASFDFSTPGDPDICDPRPDSQRAASPLSPQLGDLRYSMHAYIPEPDDTSPGGIGLPATDPVTGEIISAHPNVYGRAVETYASQGADIVSVLNGWETLDDLINGNIVDDYLTALQTNPGPIIPPSAIKNALTSPAGQAKLAALRQMVGYSPNGANGFGGTIGGGMATQDYGVANWNLMQASFAAVDPTPPEMAQDFATLNYAGGQPLPAAVAQQISMASFVAPPSITNFNGSYNNMRNIQLAAHVLMDEDIEPTALALAKYYKDKFQAHDPCLGSYGITSTGSADYRTCIWEQARRQMLGNMWRSYSDHEVGHTFGMYHNYAGSTDALNYFDPYWDLKVQNVAKTTNCGTDGVCQEMAAAIGPTPGGIALAPEWLQAPSYDTLQKGLREYQYTSIMDYNSASFNSDFQGLGKYDHATHMYQYGDMVQVFDPAVLTKVPPNADQQNHAHQIDDLVLQPFNAHYTMYPWIIADGATGEGGVSWSSQASTPLNVAVQKMVHARKWVRYDDLVNASTLDLPNGLTDQDVQARDGFDSLSTLTNPSTIMVPYRFCSDLWEGGTAWCMAFDQGADGYEQANAYIQNYKFYYYFANFKRQNQAFDLYDVSMFPGFSYYSRLWNRNFGKQAQIAQHWFNDELIIRGGQACTQTGPSLSSFPYHFAEMACGQDRTAAAIAIVDFFTKLMQTPVPDTLEFDPNNNIVCGAGECGQDGYQIQNTNTSITQMQLTLQPGPSAKYDTSTYSEDQYGMTFFYQPVTQGIWMDKLLAAQALGDYNTRFIGEINGQPLSYLISLGSIFQNDITRAMGSMMVNDPKYWPLVAVNSANPDDPANPPVTLFRNSRALSNLASGGLEGIPPLAFPITPWCPTGDPSCSTGQPPPQVGSSGLGYQPSWEAPPPGYTVLTMPANQLGAGTQPIYPPGTSGNVVIPMDPSPVYFEKIFMLSIGAIYFTRYQTGNYQDFLQGIKVTLKGDGYASNYPAPLTCDGHPDWVIVPTQTTCESGTACSPDTTCSDGSACALRNWNCAGSAANATSGGPALSVNEEAARLLSGGGTPDHQGTLTGICYYGGSNTPTENFSYANCDPDFYQEYQDPTKGEVYYAIRYTPSSSDLTEPNVDPYTNYSPAYETMRLAQKALHANATGVTAENFLDLMQSMYQFYTFYGDPLPDGIQQY